MVPLASVFLSRWQLIMAWLRASCMHLESYSGFAWDMPAHVYSSFVGSAENTASSGYSEWYCLVVREQFRQSLNSVLVAPNAAVWALSSSSFCAHLFFMMCPLDETGLLLLVPILPAARYTSSSNVLSVRWSWKSW